MKRLAIAVFVVSLVAVPSFAGNAESQKPVSKAQCVTLDHVTGAWRMQIACDQGRGAIVRFDSQEFRGDGIFAGWSQQQLRALFESLIPDTSDKAYLESPQLD